MWCNYVVRFQETEQMSGSEESQNIHGIMRCHDHAYFHRDKNAAVNIMDIYENLVSAKERPVQFRPVRGSRFT